MVRDLYERMGFRAVSRDDAEIVFEADVGAHRPRATHLEVLRCAPA
jgi:hypothetical protein